MCVTAMTGLALQFATAADPDISKLPPAAKKEGLTFDKDIKPLIENSCLKCHGAEKPKSQISRRQPRSVHQGWR